MTRSYALIGLFVLTTLLFTGCSWVNRFFTVNSTDKPITFELKLKYPIDPASIFYSKEFALYEGDGKKVNYQKQTTIKPDTLENRSHMKIIIPAHSTLEFGSLFNDTYDRYNQLFINGHVFSMEELNIISGDKTIHMIPSTFDKYYKKASDANVFYFVK
jgi:hypothetical protein